MNPWRWVDPRVNAVQVADLRAYFRGRGWELRPNPNANLLRFERPADRGEPAVLQVVPASEQLADYRQRVTELITTLSELEDRHPVAVLEEILAAGGAGTGGAGPARAGVG
jgi:hypothetical protein